MDTFKASGIVQAIDTAMGRQYQWQADMNYLFGDASESSSD